MIGYVTIYYSQCCAHFVTYTLLNFCILCSDSSIFCFKFLSICSTLTLSSVWLSSVIKFLLVRICLAVLPYTGIFRYFILLLLSYASLYLFIISLVILFSGMAGRESFLPSCIIFVYSCDAPLLSLRLNGDSTSLRILLIVHPLI